MKVGIPKIIMQTWKNSVIPEKWKKSPESIYEHMPTWKYVLMTDLDNRKFVQKHFPHFLKTYDAFPYNIQRADAIRYMWLYVHGGIYMDLDIELKGSLERLFTKDEMGISLLWMDINRLTTRDIDPDVYLVASPNIGSYITNAFMASKPGAKIWLKVLEEMQKPVAWYYKGKHFTVMNSTGPMMLSRVSKKFNYKSLSTEILFPCSICNLDCVECHKPDVLVKMLPGSSWVDWDGKIILFCFCNWRFILFLVFIVLILSWLIIRCR